MSRWFLKPLILLGAVAVVLAVVILAGKLALDDLARRGRYTLAFAEIECSAPPGLSREEFLEQVQYYASAPATMTLMDEELPRRLAEDFARHPWVEKVENVQIVPPRSVRVKLVFRTPVLAVRWSGGLSAVDARGILLPRSAPTEGLPLFPGRAAHPGPEGTAWGDPAVEAAARSLRH